MRKLFGTDGIRGLANVEPMTPELAMTLGGAIVQEALRREEGGPAVVLIGKDTRRSGDLLEHALAAGVASMGGRGAVAFNSGNSRTKHHVALRPTI